MMATHPCLPISKQYKTRMFAFFYPIPKEESPTLVVNSHISCRCAVKTLCWTCAKIFVYDWHPSYYAPAGRHCTDIFVYIEKRVCEQSLLLYTMHYTENMYNIKNMQNTINMVYMANMQNTRNMVYMSQI